MYAYSRNLSFLQYHPMFRTVNDKLESRFNQDDRSINDTLCQFLYLYYSPSMPSLTINQTFEIGTKDTMILEPINEQTSDDVRLLVDWMQREGAGNFIARIQDLINMIIEIYGEQIYPDIRHEILFIFHPVFDDQEDTIRMSLMKVTFHKSIVEQPFLYFFSRSSRQIKVEINYLGRSTYQRR